MTHKHITTTMTPSDVSLTYLEMLSQETALAEADIMSQAMEIGLRKLWQEHILERYLHQKITRAEAITWIGQDLVIVAERQHEAMLEDVAWGLQ